MKFMCIGEWDPKDSEKLRKKRQQIGAEREKFPEKFPKPLGVQEGVHAGNLGGNTKVFALYETDDAQQLGNFQEYYSPEAKIKWIPII